MSQTWIQQTSTSWEDYEALANASITSSAPPAQAGGSAAQPAGSAAQAAGSVAQPAGNAARAEDLGLSGPECPQEEEPGECPTDAYAMWFGSDAPESDPEGLEPTWGEEVSDLWYAELRDHDWKGLPEWAETLRGLVHVAEVVGNARKAIQAIDALLSTSRADPGEVVLRRFVDVFDAVRAFLPYTAGLSEYLAALSACMKEVCAQVSNFAALVQQRERRFDGQDGMMPAWPEVWPGGRVMYTFLTAVGNGEQPAISDAVVDFTMDNHGELTFVTGEAPPALRQSALGLDLLAEDTVDLPALADWYHRHVETLQRHFYGERAPMFPSSG